MLRMTCLVLNTLGVLSSTRRKSWQSTKLFRLNSKSMRKNLWRNLASLRILEVFLFSITVVAAVTRVKINIKRVNVKNMRARSKSVKSKKKLGSALAYIL